MVQGEGNKYDETVFQVLIVKVLHIIKRLRFVRFHLIYTFEIRQVSVQRFRSICQVLAHTFQAFVRFHPHLHFKHS